MSDQPKPEIVDLIPAEALDAATAAVAKIICNDHDEEIAAAALTAVWPHMLRAAARLIREEKPTSLGDDGWNAIADQAENADYPRERVLALRRRQNFSTDTVEVAYQHGHAAAARLLTAAADTRTQEDPRG